MVRFKYIIIKLHRSVSYGSFTTVEAVHMVAKIWMDNLNQNNHKTNNSVNVQNYSTTSILNFLTTVTINTTTALSFAFVTSNNTMKVSVTLPCRSVAESLHHARQILHLWLCSEEPVMLYCATGGRNRAPPRGHLLVAVPLGLCTIAKCLQIW